mmetsp:Transcript_58038/g.170354  ORF Transcript_58038/g.170354 Transcript_58038/m.170354 type:complete len:204 (-) Transcript_58038:91-702(-)
MRVGHEHDEDGARGDAQHPGAGHRPPEAGARAGGGGEGGSAHRGPEDEDRAGEDEAGRGGAGAGAPAHHGADEGASERDGLHERAVPEFPEGAQADDGLHEGGLPEDDGQDARTGGQEYRRAQEGLAVQGRRRKAGLEDGPPDERSADARKEADGPRPARTAEARGAAAGGRGARGHDRAGRGRLHRAAHAEAGVHARSGRGR